MFKWLKKEWNEVWYYDGLDKLKKFSKRLGYDYPKVLLNKYFEEISAQSKMTNITELRMIFFEKKDGKINKIFNNRFPVDSEVILKSNCVQNEESELEDLSEEELKKYKEEFKEHNKEKGKFKITIDFIPEEDTKEESKNVQVD